MQDIVIKVIPRNPYYHKGLLSHVGIIKIGDFEEEFIMPIEWWDTKDYQRQWKEGLERIKTHDTSCLVTTVQNMELDPLVFWWVLYKEEREKTIFVQNHLLYSSIFEPLLKRLPFFSVETCYQYIRSRQEMSEGEMKVSEWSVPIKPT